MTDQIEADLRAKTVADLEKDDAGIVKRWKAEIELADETEKDWREEVKEVWKEYEGKESRANSFNILWSNTETLRPALYNSTPEPDIRRRFRDADPVGKAASTVLDRSLSYSIDTDDFDETIQDAVLDLLLPGRGLARVRYVPTTVPQEDELGQPILDENDEPQEKLVDEKTIVDHVQWDDFRRGPGKRWKDVPWIAFRHEMNLDTLIDFFGEEIAYKVPLSEIEPTNKQGSTENDVRQVFRVAEVWEIWDKDQQRVLFICKDYADQALRIDSDPLGLPGFWPIPRPMIAVENSRSLIPTPIYRLYKVQAQELEKVSTRINRIIDACKVRGAYAAMVKEAANIIDAGDNEMVPIEAVAELASFGGLDKAIWIMPVEKLATVLVELYRARDQIKATIYEITGISDIIRGATEASETATAQQLKSQWGSLRLQKIQQEVQRFVRDLMRLMADVISTRFQPETLAQMTQIQLPTGEQKQMAVMQLRVAQQAAQQPVSGPDGQPLPPPQISPQVQQIAQTPSWDEVMDVLRNDTRRCYKIDVETDSTIAETLERDMAGLQEVITALGNLINGSAQAIQSGMLPIEAVKSLALAMVRRARLGSAVEDAIDQIQAPAPEQPETPQADPQAMLDELMNAIKAPKKLVAQAGPDGRVEGEIQEAA